MHSLFNIAVWSESKNDSDSLKLADKLGIPLYIQETPPNPGALDWLYFYDEGELFLHSYKYPEFKPISINYLSKEFTKRWKSFSRNDLLGKAIGIKKGIKTVLDATCGLGYDSFLLASMNEIEVFTCERNPIIAELVMNALLRVKEEGRFEEFPLYFYLGDAKTFLLSDQKFDTIYLDPMFPRESNKSASQKKEMLLFRNLVGNDDDVVDLFRLSLKRANNRVVVKRPDDAPKIVEDILPDIVFPGKTIRFDVYLKK